MNKENVNVRDNILFGEDYNKEKYLGGTRHFRNLGYAEVKQLMDEDFLDPDDCQNCSPSAEELADFLKGHQDFTAFGYAVCPERSDYRVTIDGIESDDPFENIEEAEDFVSLCRFADEFDMNPPYAWWD